MVLIPEDDYVAIMEVLKTVYKPSDRELYEFGIALPVLLGSKQNRRLLEDYEQWKLDKAEGLV